MQRDGENEYGRFLHFEPLTMVPFDRTALELSLLSEEELALLNTIPESMGEGCSKIKYLSVAPMFAEAIERIYQEISIAKLFN